MKLSALHAAIGGVLKNDIDFCTIVSNTDKVVKGALFVCLTGTKIDSHTLAYQAVQKGAVALLVEKFLPLDVAQLLCENTHRALSMALAAFYDISSKNMQIIGVTGTNGKTSTAYMLQRVFAQAGYEAAYVGTLGVVAKEYLEPPTLTTPDPIELFALLDRLYQRGVRYFFLEVSAHAIYWHKIDGIRFNAVVFTNLSQDHLDFFGTIDKYAQTKLSLFSYAHTALGVVNADDAWGCKILQTFQIPMVTYGLRNPCDVFAVQIRDTFDSMRFVVNAYDVVYMVETNLHGEFNVYNILAVATVCGYYGIEANALQAALYSIQVPGRFNVVVKDGIDFVIDYAHTPDGLQNSLMACRKLSKGKLITVFGCGGDRDSDKRSKMGAVARSLADYVIITNDNPRSEEPITIARNIEAGMGYFENYEIILDRKEAIERAKALCKKGDCVLIAGKGNEPYIETAQGKVPYSDYAVVESLQ